MNLAADMGRHSGRATPSLLDAPYRQFDDETGRRSTYPTPIPVQINPATSQISWNSEKSPFKELRYGYMDGVELHDAGCDQIVTICLPSQPLRETPLLMKIGIRNILISCLGMPIDYVGQTIELEY